MAFLSERIAKLSQLVGKRYLEAPPEADEWIAWGYQNHVLVAAKFAQELALRFSGSVENCVAGALVHDIADTEMERGQDGHQKRSLQLGRSMLLEAGFSDKQSSKIVDEVAAPHSCKKSLLPETLDGKIFATADALAHLSNDFFVYLCWARRDKRYEDYRRWAAKKIEKAYHRKIFFDEIRAEWDARYHFLKGLFAAEQTPRETQLID